MSESTAPHICLTATEVKEIKDWMQTTQEQVFFKGYVLGFSLGTLFGAALVMALARR